MAKGLNALDWFHEEYCSSCDVPGKDCKPGSPKELACIMAAILHELTSQAE